jgi:hypothetical protein
MDQYDSNIGLFVCVWGDASLPFFTDSYGLKCVRVDPSPPLYLKLDMVIGTQWQFFCREIVRHAAT